MKELLEVIVKEIVDDKDSVVIEERKDGNFSGFKVKVNKADMGNLIGKQGKMAQSIRNVMKAVAGKEHKKVSIEFTEK